ncbi:MAG: DUF4364 family protein, partial [Ruminiclostridium sp.]|nr:DUF4364 family protein [Ruminiclostridium sp.]
MLIKETIMYESPKITIDEKLTIQIYLCYILEQLGELTEDQLSDIVTEIDAVSGLEFFEALSLSVEKQLIEICVEKNVKRLSLLPQGLTMAKEFFRRIPLSIREKTLEYGQY